LPVAITQQRKESACLWRTRTDRVNRKMQGIQVGLWRVLTEWYTRESVFKRMVRNESFDAL
jgi:hypothetical protein